MVKLDFNGNWNFKLDGESGQKPISLPHDAMLECPRDAQSPGGSGIAYFTGGKYVYTKTFQPPADWEQKNIYIEFEAIYKKAKIWINDKLLPDIPAYGYIPYILDISGYLRYAEDNTICVAADNTALPNSRWYSGGGIHRPAWLYVANKTHIPPQGVRITTLSHTPAVVRVETASTDEGTVTVEILWNGEVCVSGEGLSVELTVPDAKLWSEHTPNLYTCRVRLCRNGGVEDEYIEKFGIRTIQWSPQGFCINGENTLLRGGCVHHDNGLLGACAYEGAEERRVRIMKRAGFNALRSAHNPMSKAMLRACDKYGMYVMDELWDMWYHPKNSEDYAKDFKENYANDIDSFVKRGYNHACLVMYSIGNELTEPGEQQGLALAEDIIGRMRSLDTTRPLTCGVNPIILYTSTLAKNSQDEQETQSKPKSKKKAPMNSTTYNIMVQALGSMNFLTSLPGLDRAVTPFYNMLDIAGYNYAQGRYEKDGKLHPERVIVGSETYPHNIAKNWEMVERLPYLIGDFMWTAWDYIGETGLGAWSYEEDAGFLAKPFPWLLADTGAIDILGRVGAQAELAAIAWNKRNTPYIGVSPLNHSGERLYKAVWRGTNVLPTWSWKGCDGKRAHIEVYSKAHKVALVLNGRHIATKRTKNCKATFNALYEPGILEAVAYDDHGSEISRSSLHSACAETRLWILPEQENPTVGELLYLNIALGDDDGVVESAADTNIEIEVDGGELLGFGSANPRTEGSFKSSRCTTWYGYAQAVVRCTHEGSIAVRISGKGVATQDKQIMVREKSMA